MFRKIFLALFTIMISAGSVFTQPVNQDVKSLLQELREGQKRIEERLTSVEVRLARVEEAQKALGTRIESLEKRSDSQFGSLEKRLDSEVGGLRWLMVLLIAIGLIPVVSKIFERKERVEYETLNQNVTQTVSLLI